MKRWWLICVLVLAVLLKILIPSNVEIQRELMSFLGMEYETVQAFGHGRYRTAP